MIVFDDVIADIISNKKLNQIVAKIFIRWRKPNIFTVFITKVYSAAQKHVRLNCTHFSLWKFQTRKSFSKSHLIIYQILTLKTSGIFTKMHCATITFLVNDTFALENSLRFKLNLLDTLKEEIFAVRPDLEI